MQLNSDLNQRVVINTEKISKEFFLMSMALIPKVLGFAVPMVVSILLSVRKVV